MNRESSFGMPSQRREGGEDMVCGKCWWHKPCLQRDGSSAFECMNDTSEYFGVVTPWGGRCEEFEER